MSYTLDNLDIFGVWFLDGPDNYAHYNFVREVLLWLLYGLSVACLRIELTKLRTGSSVCASGEGHRARGAVRVRGRAHRQREAGRALAQDPEGSLRHRPHQHTGRRDLTPSLLSLIDLGSERDRPDERRPAVHGEEVAVHEPSHHARERLGVGRRLNAVN